MKQGTASLVALFCWLHSMRGRIAGRLTLTAVSDEETFGPYGARWLMEHHGPEVLGDCLLNAEPGAPTTVRFGEKAPLWIGINVQTTGCHGAYTHKSPSATRIAAAIIEGLAALEETPVALPAAVADAIAEGAVEIDRVHLPGAARTMGRVTLNVGTWRGGTLVNMLPGHSRIEADIRLPWGIAPEEMVKRIAAIVASHDGARMHVISEQTPRWSDPTHPMVGHIRRNAAEIAGWRVLPIPSLAGTDARLWRERGIPAFTYGTTATNVAMPDERTDIAEWLRVVRVHALSALDYLT
jgi:succinyl-diaminopimelate desuccinylase